MSLIFDKFSTLAQAESFASFVENQFGLGTQTYDNEGEAQLADPFPWRLDAPIVHVDRVYPDGTETTIEQEERIQLLVQDYDGTFAGT